MPSYIIKPLKADLKNYLEKHSLEKKWQKAKLTLEINPAYPALNFEKVVLEGIVFYSFRLDKKYRGICLLNGGEFEIIAFTNHYR